MLTQIHAIFDVMSMLYLHAKTFIIELIKCVWNYLYQIISVGCILGFITMKKGMNNVFLNAITNDSIFSAINFVGQFKSDFVLSKYVGSFIEGLHLESECSIVERYIYYGLIGVTSLICNVLFWGNYNVLIYYTLIITTHPFIMDILLRKTKIKILIDSIFEKINKLIKFIILSLYSFSINNITRAILNKNLHITPTDLTQFYQNKSLSHLVDFLKIFAISTVIQLMESSGSMYARIVKMLYKYGAIIDVKTEYNEPDPFVNITDPKLKLTKIIEDRRWELFYNPKILKILIKLYRESKGASFIDQIKQYLLYLEILVSKFFAFYSFAILFDTTLIPIALSFIIKSSETTEFKFYVPKFLSLIMSFLKYDHFTVLIVSELFEIVFNKLTYFIMNGIYNKLYEQRYLLIHVNIYNLEILFNNVIAILINSVNNVLLNILCAGLISYNSKNWWITIYIFFFGGFSGYTTCQLVLNSLILYFVINIYNHKTTPQQIVNIHHNVVDSYLTKMSNSVDVRQYNNTNIIDDYMDSHFVEHDLLSSVLVDGNKSLVESLNKVK